MTTEEYLAEMNGKIEALTLACSLIISLSPEKNKIHQKLKAISLLAENDKNKSPHQKNYINGIKSAISTMEETLEIASFASLATGREH
jgi:hypothetical protein